MKQLGKENFCYPLTPIPHPRADGKVGGMWHLGTWARGGLGTAGGALNSIREGFSSLGDPRIVHPHFSGQTEWDLGAGRSRTPQQRPIPAEQPQHCSVPCSAWIFHISPAEPRPAVANKSLSASPAWICAQSSWRSDS